MTPTLKSKFDIWGPPLLFILTIIGLAVAGEHRLTVLEETQKTMTHTMDDVAFIVDRLQQTQIRVVTLVGEIEKRHTGEDSKR